MTSTLGPPVTVRLAGGRLQPADGPELPAYTADELAEHTAALKRHAANLPSLPPERLSPAVALSVQVAEREAAIREVHDAALDRIGRAMADRAHVLAGGRTVVSYPADGAAPTTRQDGETASAGRFRSVQAEHGAAGAAVRRGPRQEAVAKAQEIAAGLAWDRILAGMPEDDPARAWSFDRMAFWIRERWPKPHHMPALRTLVGYLQAAVKRRLLPPLSEWVEASTVPTEQSKP